MARAFIGYDNVVDHAATVLSASDAISTLPAENLRHPHVAKIWRASGASATITLDAGGEVAADALGLFGTNLTATGALSLTATPGGAVATAMQSISDDHDQAIAVFDGRVTAQIWELSLSDASLAQLEVGRLFLGPVMRPAVNVELPVRWGIEDPSEVRTTAGGQRLTFKRPVRRTAQFGWSALSENEAVGDLLGRLDRISGRRQDVLFVQDEEAVGEALHERAIWGRLGQLDPVEHPSFGVYAKRYRIEESK